MARENPLWGAPRIAMELARLGLPVAERTVAKYLDRFRPKPGQPSPRWRAFLTANAKALWACDFCCVRTVMFRTLYVFFLIRHDTREIVHIRVTAHPTAQWTGQQLVNACFDREPPQYLLRDRDGIFGFDFQRRVKSLGITQVLSPVHAPKANAIAERFVGTLRRECLDHVLIVNERHLQQVVAEFQDYYNRHRTHQTLGGQTPIPSPDPPPTGPPARIVAIPVLGGLHHHYQRAA